VTPSAAVVPGANGKIAFTRPEKILTMEPDGSGITLVRSGASDPAWSPDGTRIAFSGRRQSGLTEIFIMSADGSEAERITNFRSGFNLSPTWSPDGMTIVFQHNDDNGDDLYSVTVNGSGLTRLSHSPRVVERAPEWSPDGSLILFSRLGPRGGYRLNREELFVMNPDGSSLVRITNNHVQDIQGSWSPDGERVVFVRATRTFGTKTFIMSADGTDATRLTDDEYEEFWPSFSPDGTMVVFARCLDFTCDIFLLEPSGSSLSQLTNTPQIDSRPDWQTV
jgi:TolB protein